MGWVMASNDWGTVELGQLIDVKHGFAFRGEYFHDEPPGDILLTPGNFAIGGGFKYDKLKYYIGPVPKDYILSPGDLLVTMTDLSKAADTLGYPALVPKNLTGQRYLHNQRLGLVVINDPNNLDKLFLYHAMRHKAYRDEIVAGATGTTVKHTSPTKIKRFRIQLPSRSEQEAIAKVLSSLDDKIELGRWMNRTLEAIARTIFRAWFVDFEPVKAKAAGASEFRGMSQDVFDQLPDHFVESELGFVPAEWKVVPLSELINILGGGTPKRKVSQYWNGSIPWFSIRDAPADGDIFVIDTEEAITESGVNNSAAKVMRAGTTIISARGTVGRLAITAVPMAMNQSCYGAQGVDGIGDSFVYFSLRDAVAELQQRTHGSVFDTITRTTFNMLNRVRPEPQVLKAFEEVVAPYLRHIQINRFEARSLAAIRDALLPKMISGEIKLTDALEAP
jgi:type I restriction enzyme S subunit